MFSVSRYCQRVFQSGCINLRYIQLQFILLNMFISTWGYQLLLLVFHFSYSGGCISNCFLTLSYFTAPLGAQNNSKWALELYAWFKSWISHLLVA